MEQEKCKTCNGSGHIIKFKSEDTSYPGTVSVVSIMYVYHCPTCFGSGVKVEPIPQVP